MKSPAFAKKYLTVEQAPPKLCRAKIHNFAFLSSSSQFKRGFDADFIYDQNYKFLIDLIF